MISRRVVDFSENAPGNVRFDLEGDTHIVTGTSQSPETLPRCRVCRSARRSSTATATRCRGRG